MCKNFEIIYDAISYMWYFFEIAIIFFRKCSFNINHNNKTELYTINGTFIKLRLISSVGTISNRGTNDIL